MADTYDALLEAFSEQGTEGIHWSTYDPEKNTPDGLKTHAGLRALKNGDLLQIFADANRQEKLWEGTIDLDFELARSATMPGFGWMPHGLQRNVDPDIWMKMFEDELPCRVTPAIP